MTITLEQPHHADAVERLLDISFGPDRFAKTAYRLRDGVPPVAGLSLVSLDPATGELDGTLRFWPVLIGGLTPTLLLGPIAVSPGRRSEGLGATLIRHGLNRAASHGWRSVVLVGDAPYYARFGFTRALTLGMSMPGPVDYDRFLGLELVPGALSGAAGTLMPWPDQPAPPALTRPLAPARPAAPGAEEVPLLPLAVATPA